MFEEVFLNIKLIYVSLLRPSNVFNRLIRPSFFGVTHEPLQVRLKKYYS